MGINVSVDDDFQKAQQSLGPCLWNGWNGAEIQDLYEKHIQLTG